MYVLNINVHVVGYWRSVWCSRIHGIAKFKIL